MTSNKTLDILAYNRIGKDIFISDLNIVMIKPTTLIILFISIVCTSLKAQLHQDSLANVLNTPDGWLIEHLNLPLSFAPDLEYSGYEDLRFAKDWSKKDHDHFWCYTFVWVLDENPKINESTLESDMKTYYDGLMEVDNSISIFMKQSAEDSTKFIGKVKTHDKFFTKQPISLNFYVESSYCKDWNKHLVRFNISPKSFGEIAWTKLEEIHIKSNCVE